MTNFALIPYDDKYSTSVDQLFLELQFHEHQFDSAKTTNPDSVTKYRLELLNSIEENSGQFWLAVDTNEKAIGLVAWYIEKEIEYENPYGYISDIVVARKLRNQGIGKQLLQKAMDEIRRAGLKRAHIGVMLKNTETKDFYKKFGFTEYSVEMTKEL